jgi:hypothetical protein
MISAGFKRESWMWDLSRELLRGARYSRFHSYGEAATTLCTLIFHRDPVVALVVGYLRQISSTALNNVMFQIGPADVVFGQSSVSSWLVIHLPL